MCIDGPVVSMQVVNVGREQMTQVQGMLAKCHQTYFEKQKALCDTINAEKASGRI